MELESNSGLFKYNKNFLMILFLTLFLTSFSGIVSAAPDLVPNSVSSSDYSVKLGDSITVSWTVKNKGTSSTVNSFYNKISLATSSYGTSPLNLGHYSMGSISSGASSSTSKSVKIPTTAIVGNCYYLTVWADAYQSITESNEYNNIEKASSKVCITTPQCTSHSSYSCIGGDVYWFNSCNVKEDKKQECGTSGYSGSNFCYDNDVYRNYITKGCSGNSCSSNNQKIKQQECTYGCSNNVCNSAPQSIACYSNSGCGTNGPIMGTESCSNNDVYEQYRTYTCQNPGTSSSFCSSSTNLQLKQSCGSNQICDTGQCVEKTESLKFLTLPFNDKTMVITSGWKRDDGIEIHGGIDYDINYVPTPDTFEVLAAADGIVEKIDNTICQDGRGCFVIINHTDYRTPDGKTYYNTRYLHLKKGSIKFSEGSLVERGEVIAMAGNTGTVKVHLHFDVSEGEPKGMFKDSNGKRVAPSNRVDPYDLYDKKSEYGGGVGSESGPNYLWKTIPPSFPKIPEEVIILSTTNTIEQDQKITLKVVINNLISKVLFYLKWPGSYLDFVLVKPDGTIIDKDTASSDPNIEFIGTFNESQYRIENPDTGEWTIEVTGTDVPEGSLIYDLDVIGLSTITADVPTDKDITPPQISLTLNPLKDYYLHDEPLPINNNVEDPLIQGTPSGIASIEWLIDGITVQDPTDISNLLGKHTLTLNAIDKAGNPSSKSIDFVVALHLNKLFVTPESLKINPGVMTVHTEFPEKYTESIILTGTLDKTPYEKIANKNIKFKRKDVENYLQSIGEQLDIHFVVEGDFEFKGDAYIFYGEDSIKEIKN